jgi:hypothetical protein
MQQPLILHFQLCTVYKSVTCIHCVQLLFDLFHAHAAIRELLKAASPTVKTSERDQPLYKGQLGCCSEVLVQ